MNIPLLQNAVIEIKSEIEKAITTASLNGRRYPNGQKAKEALIRSSGLILKVHEVVKVSLHEKLLKGKRKFSIHPPLKCSSPELSITGFIKTKKQDVVVLFDGDAPTQEQVSSGPLIGETDLIGRIISERSLVIGIRSQLSSVAKNFDTLMERAFAETLNLRLRLPNLVMGEVYLLPVAEYDDREMENNRVAWKTRPVPVEKFIRTFIGISGRGVKTDGQDLYKYERSALLLVDLKKSPPKLFLTLEELKKHGHVSNSFQADFNMLSPQNFTDELIKIHELRHAKS